MSKTEIGINFLIKSPHKIDENFQYRGIWIREKPDPDPVLKIMDPDPVSPERLDPDPDPVNIRPDPKPCL